MISDVRPTVNPQRRPAHVTVYKWSHTTLRTRYNPSTVVGDVCPRAVVAVVPAGSAGARRRRRALRFGSHRVTLPRLLGTAELGTTPNDSERLRTTHYDRWAGDWNSVHTELEGVGWTSQQDFGESGVAGSRGNKPGVGVRVGFRHRLSSFDTATFVGILELICYMRSPKTHQLTEVVK